MIRQQQPATCNLQLTSEKAAFDKNWLMEVAAYVEAIIPTITIISNTSR